MDIKFIEKNGETIFPFVVYGGNRSETVLKWHKRVYDYFQIPMNYFDCPFPFISHGSALNEVISNVIDSENKPDYFIATEMDCIPLIPNIIDVIYDKIKYKDTIFSHAQQSNHIKKNDGTFNHPYASPGFLSFSRELYNDVGRPTLDHSDKYDCCENLTIECEKQGKCITLIWPKDVHLKNCELGQNSYFGMGNNFGGLIYHAMQQNNPIFEHLFIKECKKIAKN